MGLRIFGQVIAPLLIIRRVANQSALTNDSIATGHTSPFKVRSRGELVSGGGTQPNVPEVWFGRDSYQSNPDVLVGPNRT